MIGWFEYNTTILLAHSKLCTFMGYLLCNIDQPDDHKIENGDVGWFEPNTTFLLAYSKFCTPIGYLLCNIDETADHKVENGDEPEEKEPCSPVQVHS